MANEMFTTRSGKQVEVKDIYLPKSLVTTAMRLQEDFLLRGKGYTLSYVIMLMLTDGASHIRASWKAAEKNKRNGQIGAYINAQLKAGLPIDRKHIEKLSGIQASKVEVEFDEADESSEESSDASIQDAEFTDLTDEQLDAATNPNSVS